MVKLVNLLFRTKKRAVVANETYRLVFNDFLAGGGDAYLYGYYAKYVEQLSLVLMLSVII